MGNESRVIITADSAQAIREFNRLRTQSTSSLRDIAAYSDKVGAALGAIGLGTGLAGIVKMSDEYAKFTAQLRLATVSQREYNAAYADVKRIANSSQQALDGTGTLYARIANGTRELGTTQKQVAEITETVNLALKVSGATATESASAQLQLSQAFASGTLRGEEFNAVNEAAPRLMKALADGMGLPIGALKGLAGEGKITSKIMAEVLPNALVALREEGKKVATIGGAFTVLKNEFMEFTAIKAQANGTVNILTTSIKLLSDNINVLFAATAGLLTLKMAGYFFMGVAAVQAYFASNAELAALLVVERAALISKAEALVASTTAVSASTSAKLVEAEATLAGLVAQKSALLAARELVFAQYNQAKANIAAAEAAIAAASSAGALSFALRVERASTLDLAVAEQARVTALAELTASSIALGRVSAQLATATASVTAATTADTAATGARTAATNGLNGAIGRTAVTASLASKALGFLGGPIGIITTLLSVGAAAWVLWGSKGSEAEKAVTTTLAEEIDEYLANLNKQIEKLKERNELANKKMTTGAAPETDGEKNRERILAEINSIGKRTDLDIVAKSALMGVWGGRLNEINQEMETFNSEQQKNKAFTRNADIKTWFDQNGTAAQKMAAELDELKKKFGEIPPEMEKLVRAKYADKGVAAGLKKEEQAYSTLIASIREKIEAGRLENATDVDATESQKLRIKLDEASKVNKLKLADAHLTATYAALDELAAVEKVAKARATEKDVSTHIQESTLARQDSAAALVVEYQMMGKSSDARELAMVAVREQTALEKFLLQEKVAGKVVTDDQIKRLTEEAAARVRVEQATLAQTKALGYAAQLADENRRFAAESLFDEKARAAAMLKIDATMWQERIFLAGAGTDAQKRLQEEYSIWYSNQLAKPEIEANRKMWDSIESTAKDTFMSIGDSGISAIDRIWGALKNGLFAWLYQVTLKKWIINIGASVSGAGAAGLTSADGIGLTGGAAGGGLGGIASLAQSAKTAYTIASQGFAGITAGLGTSVVSLGSLFGSTAIEAFGAGLGSTGLVGAADAAGLYAASGGVGSAGAVTAGAYAGAAVTAAAGIAAGVLGGRMISGQYGSNSTVNAGTGIGAIAGAFMGGPIGAAIGGALGGVIGGLGNRIFGMSDKKYGETGITGTLSGSGFTGNEYAKWTQKGGWLRSDKSDTDRKAVDATTSNAFVETYAAIRNVSATLANTLGVDTTSLATRAQALNINLTGLTTEADRLGAVTKFFEGVGNAIALELVPSLGQFKVGNEELSTTLQRVAGNYAGVDAALQLIGRTSQDAFGAVGVATIGARENLIKLAGSLDSLSSGTSFFAENFLSEAEQMAPVLATVADTLGKLGMAGTTTMDDYKKKVLGLNLASAADQELYIKLLALAPAFKAAADYSSQLAAATGNYAAVVKTASEIASERMDLQKQLNELTKSETELLAIQRSSVATVNRALFDQVQAAKAVVSAKDALGKAYEKESAAAQTALDKSKSWVATLNGLNASMALGSQSILTPEQRYAEARAQFEKTLAAANAGDATAQSGLSAAEQAFLTASQVVNASDAKYAADYARVIAANEDAAKWASAQVDVQQASLDAIKAQVSGLITINDSVLTVAQAIANLHAAMGMATGLGVDFTNAPAAAAPVAFSSAPAPVVFDAMRYSAGSNAASDALVAEIRSLNARLDAQTAEIKGLRADQDKQTGAAIKATVESNAVAARTVVDGVDKSARAAARVKQVEYSK
ncbi:tape measure protein [Janthinobacterium sp. SUN033]|uniref:tape measure protein n=1 Tax=Janthinobacterium sp. SUN033 TaxID=3002439 RepID=UPI0025B1F7AB|nr:tape measure protein [Janthinobacterium sp. SUN033]MDN2675639.1 tape measure protein [Janthinobacterium sp. SUN033]